MKNSQVLKYIIILFLGWKVAILFITYFGFSIIPSIDNENNIYIAPNSKDDYWQKWANWDGGHFISIAENGYLPIQTVFFPGYPMLINTFMYLGFSPLWGGLIISNICVIIALFFLFKLISLDFGEKIAKKSIFTLLIFPTSFYLGAVYSESLFLASSLAAFYYARKNNWLLASVLAAISVATRLIGIAVVLGILAEFFLAKKSKLFSKEFFFLVFSLIPLPLYMYYQQVKFGNSLSFLTNESLWDRQASFPWQAVQNSLNYLSIGNFLQFGNGARVLVDLLSFVILAGTFVLFFKKMRKSYRVFYFLALMIPLYSGTLTSFPRYALVIFPFYFTVALLKNELVQKIGIILSLLLLSAYSILFINGFWVT